MLIRFPGGRRRRLDPGRRRRPRPSRHARHRHPRLHGRDRRSHRPRPRRRRARARARRRRRPARQPPPLARRAATSRAPTWCAWCAPIAAVAEPRGPAGGRRRPTGDGTAASPRRRDRRRRHGRTRSPTAIPPCALSPGADDGVALVELWQTGGPLAAARAGRRPRGRLGARAAGRRRRVPAGCASPPATIPARPAGTRRTTIDVDIVVSGRLELALPDTEPVVVGPGEAVVQRGTHHKWQPVGDEAVEFVVAHARRKADRCRRCLLTEDHDRARLLTFNRPDRANAFNEDAVPHGRPTRCAPRAPTTTSRWSCSPARARRSAPAPTCSRWRRPSDGTATSRDGFPAFVDTLAGVPEAVVAAVNGSAVGLGFTMLAHCDLVFVSDRARLLAPFTTMGVAPEAASSYLLPRRMGRQQASLSLFTSDWISAEQAVATGLAVKQCSPEALVGGDARARDAHRGEVVAVAHGHEATAARRRAGRHRPGPPARERRVRRAARAPQRTRRRARPARGLTGARDRAQP